MDTNTESPTSPTPSPAEVKADLASRFAAGSISLEEYTKEIEVLAVLTVPVHGKGKNPRKPAPRADFVRAYSAFATTKARREHVLSIAPTDRVQVYSGPTKASVGAAYDLGARRGEEIEGIATTVSYAKGGKVIVSDAAHAVGTALALLDALASKKDLPRNHPERRAIVKAIRAL